MPDALRTVLNCNDAGPGSLRDTIASASGTDTIDLTHLQCSDITLISGEIKVTVSQLKLMGPGADPTSSHHLTIYGGASYGYRNRIFSAGGTLTISGLKLTDAYFQGQGALVKGGCIFSGDSLVIEDSIISGCKVAASYGANVPASGGAIYAAQNLLVTNSIITNNVAYSSASTAYGGGIATGGFLTIENSAVSGNKAIAPWANSIGGGLDVVGWGDVSIFGSTISGNEADFEGGMRVSTLGAATVTNSTLSGNYASIYVGGAFFSSTSVTLTNSTIAQNSAFVANYSVGIYSEYDLTTESSIVADNVDVLSGTTLDIVAPKIVGSANLITSASVAIPPDTITACPRLTALKDHGGPTETHALVRASPGINAGSNTIPLTTDQRGDVPYPRVFGARADIGAFEWQGESNDSVFRSAFENRCDRYD